MVSTPLIFATRNANKVRELSAQVGDFFALKTLDDIGHSDELAEDFETLEENARQKAEFIFEKYGVNCFSEDTGLEISALEGKPGVHTAHYSGTRDNKANINKVLEQLHQNKDRTARFRTVIYLILDGKHYPFEGIVNGTIATEVSSGSEGFGYDPIFIPEGFDRTFADLPLELKKDISHRGKAVKKLIDFLKSVEDH